MEKLNERTIEERLDKMEGWVYKDGAIETSFQFADFREAFSKMTLIAFECEAQGHHPDWTNVYNNLTIRLNTHDANGITEKDFRLAHSIWQIIHEDSK
ncbi:4a-hydroxytetrahydrobiopterin dehydratase [Zeaxanthinibacter enoshimensis]|uniref:Putative pterin-4-alpha-carbinolamine dehydratase n=1 Tax=Zeaxanthinibacter enoshimensis TaxID=392009 RepID=A0A4V3D3R3_9FLAO|nr:4a-hydroxytetrahydrobiopterin dehydratase [Zeaxanthinibacter enoshimensis]TDQ31033.1 4a-hydroxytetrahydrobiopterin dehydratase [Zeaxanthinibacter enoshimensis]